MRVAVTGAAGRLGRALIEALEEAPFTGPRGPIAWSRPALDLDTLTGASVAELITADRPELVIHAAAWTDVDGCARDPALALRRNGEAAAIVAEACAEHGVGFALVSTNEVFDGARTDRVPYATTDERRAINPYAASKLAAEQAIERLAADHGTAALAILRTSWLHGPPGNDFPAKIAAAARRAKDAGEPLRAVADEVGRPTYTVDVADAVVELIWEDALAAAGPEPRVHHLVNAGIATRAEWAREVVRAVRLQVEVVDVPGSTWPRASTPPAWGVLEPTPLPSGEPMRDWRDAFAHAAPALVRSLNTR
jgi:dTDP-4-dehydrorhamnose reductase